VITTDWKRRMMGCMAIDASRHVYCRIVLFSTSAPYRVVSCRVVRVVRVVWWL
jgi:hypothetical protein